MKAIKRLVAAVLATLMLATSTSFTLAAEEYSDKEAVVVAKVNGAGIMTGTDKGFEPSKSLTRAEAAAIIVRMKGISESAVKSMAGTTLFTDVAASHWASGYVNQASNLQIVKGVSATEFAPEREVTVAEFVTMAVRALGAGQLVDAEGTWPTNYVNFANENDILKDVTAIYTAVATRMNAATIVANTLEAAMWEKTGVKSNGEIEWSKSIIGYENRNAIYRTILVNVLNIEEYTNGVISDQKAKDSTISWTNGEKTFTNEDVAKTIDIAALKTAINYDVWYDKDTKEIVAIFKSVDDESDVVAFDSVKKTGNDKITVVINGEEVKYKLTMAGNPAAADVDVSFNGSELDEEYSDLNGLTDDQKENTFGQLILEEGKVVAIYAYRFDTVGKVADVTSKKVKFSAVANFAGEYENDLTDSFEFDDEDLVLNITKDGKGIKLEDLEEDDIVIAYELDDEDDTTDTFFMEVLTDTEEGKITAVGTDYIKLDGTKYTVKAGVASVQPKDEVILYLNAKDEVIYIDSVESTSEYAIVKSLSVVNSRDGLDLEVELLYSDGKVSDAFVLDESIKSGKFGYDISHLVKLTLDNAGNAQAENSDIKTNGYYADDEDGIIVGGIYEYEVKSDKLALKAYADAKDLNGYVKGKSKSYFTGDITYYVTKDDSILVLTKYKDDDNKSSVKFELVDYADLETSADITGYAVDYDADTKKAAFIVVDEINDTDKLDRATKSEDWYMVLSVASIDENDYDEEIVLVDVNGKETVLFGDGTGVVPTNFGYASIANDELTEALDMDADDFDVAEASDFAAKDGDPDVAADKLYISEDEDGVLTVVAAKGSDFKEYDLVLSDAVLYVVNDGTNLAVSKASKIEKVIIDDTTLDNTADANEIESIFFDTTETGAPEVIAIIYAK